MKKCLILLFAVLLFAGCNESKKEETTKCSISSKDVVNNYELNSEYVIYYTGDTVNRVHTVEKVKSDSDSIIDTFKTTIENMYKSMNDSYGGYEYSTKVNGNELVSTTDIDYNKMNVEQYVKDQPTLKSYFKDGKITLEGVKKIYNALGATCE